MTTQTFTAYVIDYALTQGIIKVTAQSDDGTPSIIGYKNGQYTVYSHKPKWFTDEKEAKAAAETIRTKKIASLQKQITKLEKLSFN